MNLKETIIDLSGLWYCLRSNIFQLPDSLVKRYLLFEVTNAVEVKNVNDLYLLQGKIFRVIDVIIQEGRDEKGLKFAEEIRAVINKIFKYIKNECEENNCEKDACGHRQKRRRF